MSSMKTCCDCAQAKPLEEFYVRRRASDGRQRRCKPCQKIFMASWYADDSERIRQRTDAWKRDNDDRRRAANERYRRENLAGGAANTLWHKAKKLNAIPPWADRKAIDAFYERAAELTKETGIPHQVDHIVPLESPVVCGLHVQHNLQVLTAAENRAKWHRGWPDMPEVLDGRV